MEQQSNKLFKKEETISQGDEETVVNARIKLTVNGNEEIFVNLDDNQASRDFLEMLPLTLTFEDFNNTEKIATLPNELSTEGQPSGYTPEIGDFAYYAPWGNISVFYKDFRYSNSLYKLGTIESGAEIFENMNNDFEVNIERVNQKRGKYYESYNLLLYYGQCIVYDNYNAKEKTENLYTGIK